jgi:membrane-bound lytic murein transglycosylase D
VYKIFILIFTVILSKASLVDVVSIQHNLAILNELDIDAKYITDCKLQQTYKKFLKKNKKNYTEKLNNAYLFVPKIKKMLKENNIPSSFIYLVMAESNFILKAKSRKKAIGLWQFMANTGKRYGLKKDEYIDERLDIVKSTKAAIKYLKHLHKMFGKWYIVAIAYNCGEGRIIEGITRATLDMYCNDNKNCKKNKTIRQYRKTIREYQKGNVKFKELYKIYEIVTKWKYKPTIKHLLIEQNGLKRQYIPNESRDYIRKIIVLAMMNNSNFLIADNNSHLLNRGICDLIATVKVKGGIHLKNISDIIDVSNEELQNLNQHIVQNIIPFSDKQYNIYIPYYALTQFNNNIKKIKPTPFEIYKVKAGDTLSLIGEKYKIKYQLIKKINKLKTNLLRISQKLIIPIYNKKNRNKNHCQI